MNDEETAIAAARSLVTYYHSVAYKVSGRNRRLIVFPYFITLNRSMRRSYVSIAVTTSGTFILGCRGTKYMISKDGDEAIRHAAKSSRAKALHDLNPAKLSADYVLKNAEELGVCMIGSIISRFETLKNIEQVSS